MLLTDEGFFSLPKVAPDELDDPLEPESLDDPFLDSEPGVDEPFAPADDDSLPADDDSLPAAAVLEPFLLSVR
ncbi:MAG: hypothetical protein ACLQFR_26465 [Streptosporangiaceae bacterium]